MSLFGNCDILSAPPSRAVHVKGEASSHFSAISSAWPDVSQSWDASVQRRQDSLQPSPPPLSSPPSPSVSHGSSPSTSSGRPSADFRARSPSEPSDTVSIMQARSPVQNPRWATRLVSTICRSTSRLATVNNDRSLPPPPCPVSPPDINALLGNNSRIQLPNVVVKWITYCLVLHIVALILAAGSAVFGLLAHIREMSMTCCSTCISGFAAAVAMIAFIFDIALFFLTRARINSAGGSASIGLAIWLTLTAWVLLFFSGIFFCCGRCCLDSRPSRKNKRSGSGDFEPGHNQYVDQVRLDAIKAEADRQAKQKYGSESGLPAFQEFQPLTRKESDDGFAYEDGNHIVKQPSQPQLPYQGYHDTSSPSQQPATGPTYAGGYMPGQPGGRAVDDYYDPGYPPGPRRQASQTASNYSQSTYSSPTPAPAPSLPQAGSQYLAAGGGQFGHQPRGSSCKYTLQLPSSGRPKGPCADHSAVSHQQGPSYDPFSADPSNTPPVPVPSHSPPIQQQQPNTYSDSYPSGGNQYLANPHSAYDPYQNPYTQGGQGPSRAYTLGGSGYGDNPVPDNQAGPGYIPNPYVDSYVAQAPARSTSPTHMYTAQAPQRPPGAGGAGQPPRQPTLVSMNPDNGPGPARGRGQYEDSPPTYDEHEPRPAGVWSTKS